MSLNLTAAARADIAYNSAAYQPAAATTLADVTAAVFDAGATAATAAELLLKLDLTNGDQDAALFPAPATLFGPGMVEPNGMRLTLHVVVTGGNNLTYTDPVSGAAYTEFGDLARERLTLQWSNASSAWVMVN